MAKILDIKIDSLNHREVIAKISSCLENGVFCQIATVNPEFIVTAQDDEEFKSILNNCDLNIPDGVGLKYAAWFLNQKIGERLTGVDLTWEICKLASEKGYSVYFLGGKDEIAQQAAGRIKLLYPNLKIAGAATPEVTTDGSIDNQIIDNINNSQADILLVAFGAPKQEKFIARYKESLKIKVVMGVGGTFDYIAGIITRAPKFFRTLGLEWLYRLFRQPSRFKRIFNAIIVFPILVLKYKLGIRKSPKGDTGGLND